MSEGPETIPGLSRAVEERRRERVLGHKVLWYPEVGSTNAVLREHAEAGAPTGLVVAGTVQTAGRGQGANTWSSGEGGLWFSVLLRPEISPAEAVELMPRAGAAVARALGKHLGLTATVKHPNDVLVEGRKIAGILAEAATVAGEPRPAYVVLGVGMNVANALPAELAGTATRLADYVQDVPELPEVMGYLLEELEAELL